MIEKANVLQTVHWIVTFSIGAGFLGYVNAVENKQVQTETRQEQIIKTQDEIRQDIKDARKEQQERYEKLLEAINETE